MDAHMIVILASIVAVVCLVAYGVWKQNNRPRQLDFVQGPRWNGWKVKSIRDVCSATSDGEDMMDKIIYADLDTDEYWLGKFDGVVYRSAKYHGKLVVEWNK